MLNKILLFSLSFLFVSWIFPNNDAWKKKIDPVLWSKAAQRKPAECIVVLQGQADVSLVKQLSTKEDKGKYVFYQLQKFAQQAQRNLQFFLETKKIPFHAYYIVNAIALSADQTLLETLARRDDVTFIQDNPYTHFEEPLREQNAAAGFRGGDGLPEWGVRRIKADSVWAMGYTGQGVVIGGEDTGYDWGHPALKKKYRGYLNDSTIQHAYNWHDAIHSISPLANDSLNPCGLNLVAPCDDLSHGTHTMGTMVGDDENTSDSLRNRIGVAPGARFICARNMERGNGSPATYIECFEWFLAPTDLENKNPDPSKAPHVINNSWYCSTEEGCNKSNFALMEQAVQNLKSAGIVVVISAGNAGPNCGTIAFPPALFPNSFAIGATGPSDSIAPFSSRGPVPDSLHSLNHELVKPNVCAPGRNVRSSIPNGGYAEYSGTSMAGPHTAGLVALLISANPNLAGQVDTIERIIEQTCLVRQSPQSCGGTSGLTIPNNTYGYGRIDALAAVHKARSFVPTTDLLNTQQVTVFPNPFVEKLTIECSNLHGTTQIRLYNIEGKLMQAKTLFLTNFTVIELPTAAIERGVYLYEVINDRQKFVGKVVKL